MVKGDVRIQAKTVTVAKSNGNNGGNRKQEGTGKSSGNGKRRRNRGNPAANIGGDVIPANIKSGAFTGLAHVGPQGMRGMQGCDESLSDQSKAFMLNHCDPCGEHTNSLDAARVCDGALQTSAGAFFRYADTLETPFQTEGSVTLDGDTYSALFLQFPLLRALTVVIVRAKGGEFSDAIMSIFAQSWSQIQTPADAVYPRWVALPVADSADTYFSILDTAALRNIVPPTTNGVSGTVDSYRFSSQGLNTYFNVPDLVNQGTFTAMRYPTNATVKQLTVDPNSIVGNLIYIGAQTIGQGASALLTINVGNGASPLLPSFNNLNTTLPSANFTATVALRNASGTFQSAVGHVLRYEQTTSGSIVLRNQSATTNAILTVLPPIVLVANVIQTQSTRIYETSTINGGEVVNDREFTLMALPPLTQQAMVQQNPKTQITLAKETGGCYIVSSIFQPVFEVTHSTEYRKVLFANRTTDLIDLVDPAHGWHDTHDTNFGIAAINYQSIPIACKFLVKICRSVEIVPSPDSLIGAFVTGAPVPQHEVLDACKAFNDNQPHGYPTDYNGLGVLCGKVLRVVEALPLVLRLGRNIERSVTDIVNREYEEDSIDPEPRQKGLFRRTRKR